MSKPHESHSEIRYPAIKCGRSKSKCRHKSVETIQSQIFGGKTSGSGRSCCQANNRELCSFRCYHARVCNPRSGTAIATLIDSHDEMPALPKSTERMFSFALVQATDLRADASDTLALHALWIDVLSLVVASSGKRCVYASPKSLLGRVGIGIGSAAALV